MDNEAEKSEGLSLEKLRAGDRAEFARMVEAYSGIVYRLGLKMLGNPQDAEDVLQETFLKALRALKKFDGRSALSTWLYRIATNEALMMLRRNKQVIVSLDEPSEKDDQESEPMQIVDWCCLPENELLSAEARVRMDMAIEMLPHNLRVVFLLRDIEGLSTEEAGAVLDLSETAVKTRLSRARMRLRALLTEYYGEQMGRRRVEKERMNDGT